MIKAESHHQNGWKKIRGDSHEEAKGGKSSKKVGGGSRATGIGGGLRES